jgi:hypothetical protein
LKSGPSVVQADDKTTLAPSTIRTHNLLTGT